MEPVGHDTHSDRLVTADLSLDRIANIKSPAGTLVNMRSCPDQPLPTNAVGNLNSIGITNTTKKVSSLESEAMKKWKEIKQNGFLSHPTGGRSMPEPQHGKKYRMKQRAIENKRKLETLKLEQDIKKIEATKRKHESKKMEILNAEHNIRKTEITKKEQDNNVVKDAPCSGLLSTISTGIVRRVKSYEEVHAVLESIVRLKKMHDGQVQN